MTLGLTLSIISGVIGLVMWLMVRRGAPTKDEQKLDLEREYSDTIENVHRLRSQGKHAEAENMLERLRIHAVSYRMRHKSTNPGIHPESRGE